jgi:peroxiredoxin
MLLKVGDVAPDCPLLHPDGSPARLADFNAPVLLLIFLRHLA